MKKNFKLILGLTVVVCIIISSIFVTTLNAATSTHEAEASTNNLKYASVSGTYVAFDATKDAYCEMKSVNSPASGTATLAFTYSATTACPVEIKVNGTTVVSSESFPATGGSMTTKSITATMVSGTSNVVRFKLRAAVSGFKLDKVTITTGGSSTTTSSTTTSATTSATTSTSSGSAVYTTNSDGTITVSSGTFDGGGKSYGSNIGNGSQDEDQPAVFELLSGASLTNCKIVPPAGDGIHVNGNNTVSNVTFTDVGEDAISMRSSAPGGTVRITNCSFSNGEDKILQVNKASTWYLTNLTVNGAGKVMRQNGGTTFALTVYIDGLKATNIDEAIVRSDSSSCKVYYRNITCNLAQSDWWYGELTAVAW
jgi:pectate lyase C